MMNILSDKREFDRQAKSSGEPFSLKEIQFYHDKGHTRRKAILPARRFLHDAVSLRSGIRMKYTIK